MYRVRLVGYCLGINSYCNYLYRYLVKQFCDSELRKFVEHWDLAFVIFSLLLTDRGYWSDTGKLSGSATLRYLALTTAVL